MPIPGRNRNGCFLTVDQLLNPTLAVPGRIPQFARYQDTMASAASNVVGVHYRVGKKIGEGSFGVIFEGTNLLNSQLVAIKFVRSRFVSSYLDVSIFGRWLTVERGIQEPRKSDAPQLRDEYRTYKILVGCREF